MDLIFEVGDAEYHRIDFSFDPIWGRLRISVDGENRIRDVRLASASLIARYEVPVGDREKHRVVIEMQRKLWFAGFRPRVYRVYVDDELVREEEGW